MGWDAKLLELPAFQAAFAHQQNGRNQEAAIGYAEILDEYPDHPPATYLLALSLSASHPEAAVGFFERYLELAPEDANGPYGYGMLRQRLGEHAAAVDLYHQAVTLRPDMAAAHQGLGDALEHVGKPTEALHAYDRAVAEGGGNATVHARRGVILMSFGEFATAIAALEQALAQDPAMIGAHRQIAEALERLSRPDEARQHRDIVARALGAVVQPCTGPDCQGKVLFLCGTGPGDVPIDYLFDQGRFEKIIVFPAATATSPGWDAASYLKGLPPFDIAFNAIGDPDHGGPELIVATELAGYLPRKLLNQPDRITATRRDLLPGLLADIPDTVTPRTTLIDRAGLEAKARSAEPFGPEFLLRPSGSHGGTHFEKIDDRSALREYLISVPFDRFYLTEYYDYRNADGLFRKYRFIFIDGEVYAYHLAIHDHWKIHYFRADMNSHAWMKQEEEAFMADYRAVFPPKFSNAVQAVAARLGLDYAGMDCGILPDGRLLVFEANAAMLVHLFDKQEDYPYKHVYVPRIRDAMSKMLIKRISSIK